MTSKGNIDPVELSIPIDESPVQATGIITSDNTDVDNDDTLTINGQVYTFKTTLTGAVREVLRGVTDADTTLVALRALINSGRAAVKAGGVLTSNNTNPSDGEVTVMGAKTYTYKTTLTEKAATATLTSDETQPAVGDTVTIGTRIYTFVSALTYVDDEGQTRNVAPDKILIGADADTTLANLVAAINGDTGEGTKYSFNTTAHADVSAAAVSSHATVVTARVKGTAGNSIAKAESSSHLDWDGVGAVFTLGAASTANQVKIGATANDTLQNLKDAVNGTGTPSTQYSSATVASTEILAGAIDTGAHTLTVEARTAGIAGNSLAKTENSATLDWDGAEAVMTGGVDETPVNPYVTCSAVVAHAVTLTAIPVGALGNAITLAKSAAHLTLSGLSTANFTGGGSTVGTSDPIGGNGGKLSVIVSEAPAWQGTPTYTVKIVDASGDVLYVSGNLNEGAVTRTVVEQMVAPTDKIIVTTSTVVEETLPIKVNLR